MPEEVYLVPYNVLKAPFNKVAETPKQVFSREYYEIFKNSFSNITALVAPTNSFMKTMSLLNRVPYVPLCLACPRALVPCVPTCIACHTCSWPK